MEFGKPAGVPGIGVSEYVNVAAGNFNIRDLWDI